MIEPHTNHRTLNLASIKQAEFRPPLPIREDTPRILPQQVRALLRTTGETALSGFYVEPTKAPHQQALTALLTCSDTDEQVVVVFDTLTHMHKHNLGPFVLTQHLFDGRTLHYGRFLVETDLRCTLESIRTSAHELAELTTRVQWKNFFDRAEPLYPLVATGTERQAILEPKPLALAEVSTRAGHTSQSVLLAGLAVGEGVQAELFAPEQADKLLIVCDGKVYLQKYPLWPAVLHLNRTLFESSPCAVLFLEPTGQLKRDRFLGSEHYLSQWLTSVGLPWVGTQMPLPEANRCLIAGSSLGGVAAAQVVKNIPHSVAKAVVQSGSFWWHEHGSDGEEGQLLQQWLEAPLAPTIEIFHEVGHNEGYLLSWNLAFRDVLAERSVQHSHRVYRGGHDYACWRQGIVDALTYFFGGTEEPLEPMISRRPPTVE